MTTWYQTLLDDRAGGVSLLKAEHASFQAVLERLSGAVIVIGSGLRLAGELLPQGVRYIAVEAHPVWLNGAWSPLREPPLIGGETLVAGAFEEHLPLREGAGDNAPAPWSLKHTTDPASVVADVWRILKPGEVFFVVLEDIPYAWRSWIDNYLTYELVKAEA